jgi:hypothetical protein
MTNDPIVASVRLIREELASAFDYDVHAIFSDMRNRESQFGERLVRQAVQQYPNKLVHTNRKLAPDRGSTPAAN